MTMTEAQIICEKMLFEKYQHDHNRGERLTCSQEDNGVWRYADATIDGMWQGWLAAKQNAWIDVKEHLPNDGEMVAVCYELYGQIMCDKAEFYDVNEDDEIEIPCFDVCKDNRWQRWGVEEIICWQHLPANNR